MASPPDEGFGASITFSGGFFARITNIGWSGIARNPLETTSNASTANARTFIPSSIYDAGELSVDLRLDPDTTPPITGSSETITVTYPINPDNVSAANWQAVGFLTSFDLTAPMDDVMGASATLKFTGPITVDAATS